MHLLHFIDELQVSHSCLRSFPDTIIICLLKAVGMDNMEARQRFPRLLQLVELYSDTMTTFVAKVCQLEVMFL